MNSLLALTATILTTAAYNRANGQHNESGSQRQEPVLIGSKTRDEARLSFLGNKTAGIWYSFDNWQCNAPLDDTPHGRLLFASYYSGRSIGKRMLVVSLPRTSIAHGAPETWSYRLETNSWSMIANKPQVLPGVFESSVLATVCQTKVLYIKSRRNDVPSVWIFDGVSETWHERELVKALTPYINEKEGAAYVSLPDPRASVTTSCECRHAVVGFSKKTRVVWKLACNDTNTSSLYYWTQISARPDKSNPKSYDKKGFYPRIPVYFTAVAVSSNSASTISSTILMMASDGLWKYDLYWNQWYLVNQQDKLVSNQVTTTAAYFHEKEMYMLFTMDFEQATLLQFGMTAKTWSVITVSPLGEILNSIIPHYVAISDNSRFLLYGGTGKDCKQNIWELHNTSSLEWMYSRVSGPALSPRDVGGDSAKALSTMSTNNFVYMLVDTDRLSLLERRELWKLNLLTMRWTLIKRISISLVDQNSISFCLLYENLYLLIYNYPRQTSLVIQGHDINDDSWIFRYSSPLLTPDERQPTGRIDFCVTVINSSTLLLYGGRQKVRGNEYRYLCDLWAATFDRPPAQNIKWTLLDNGCDRGDILRPPGRIRYRCVYYNNSFFAIGGGSEISPKQHLSGCHLDIWQFSLLAQRWKHAFAGDETNQACITSAIAVGPQIAVTFQRRSKYSFELEQFRHAYELWFYVIPATKWTLLSRMESYETFLPVVWNGLIFFFDTALGEISYMKLSCPPGHSSPDLYHKVCSPCSLGSYAPGAEENTCIPCPRGLTTASIGATSLSNCSVCQLSPCFYGSCIVSLTEGVPGPLCQCHVGFSGRNCQNPRFILITIFVAAAVAAVLWGLVRLVRLWKNKKIREKSLIHHVQVLTGVWQIQEEEISEMSLVGVGGYGQVYQAKYRDMMVAMKMLHIPFIKNSDMLEFEREIKFMQTVRHPNIVLFLGAGQTKEGRPFIISEFVANGSLRNLLDDVSQEIEDKRKLKFALDVARGMKFLHSLTPPRAHCDLKSDNLLRSETDIVKIADFGLGTHVDQTTLNPRSRRGVRNWLRTRNKSSSVQLPLLDLQRQDSSHDRGAVRWCAPELLSDSKTIHTTASDVYR